MEEKLPQEGQKFEGERSECGKCMATIKRLVALNNIGAVYIEVELEELRRW